MGAILCSFVVQADPFKDLTTVFRIYGFNVGIRNLFTVKEILELNSKKVMLLSEFLNGLTLERLNSIQSSFPSDQKEVIEVAVLERRPQEIRDRSIEDIIKIYNITQNPGVFYNYIGDKLDKLVKAAPDIEGKFYSTDFNYTDYQRLTKILDHNLLLYYDPLASVYVRQ